MHTARIIAAALLVAVYVNAQSASYKSCKELKSAGNTRNGLYWINTNVGVIQVYCDMTTDNGGWTYLPKTALVEHNLNINNIFKDKNAVLLRIKKKNREQTYTKLEPYPVSSVTSPFNIKLNSYTHYTKPINSPKLGSYLFLGILPKNVAANKKVQGFKSNGKPVVFKNCDANPNSLFVFFPNFHNRNPNKYHSANLIYERQGVAVDWRKTGIRSYQQLPDNYFFLTEVHFGGCGTYTSSDRWIEADGTAIGLR